MKDRRNNTRILVNHALCCLAGIAYGLFVAALLIYDEAAITNARIYWLGF